MQNGTLFYDTIYCRLGQTFSATILGGSMACPAARLNSQVCVAPATLCDRICNNAQARPPPFLCFSLASSFVVFGIARMP